MGKRKLQQFAENLTFNNLFQPSILEIKQGFLLKGKWHTEFFNNDHPIILELGCGKGEYTVRLAKRYKDKNFIGIDIKGARMWQGCKYSNEQKMKNVAFIRTRIEMIEHFFCQNEVSEIWLTFPDPQLKISKTGKRLTSPPFLNRYSNILHPGNVIHLKTDNAKLYEYTLKVIDEHKHHLLYSTDDVYNSDAPEEVRSIITFYEQKFIDEGLKIHYLEFKLNK